ncbi:MAG: hypothetical protein ACPGXL_09835 [Chitinophagales bacterium]
MDKVLERVNEQFTFDRTEYRDKVEEHTFYKRASNLHYYEAPEQKTNILDMILRYPEGDPSNFDLIKESDSLLKLALQELVNHFVSVYGSYRAVLAKQKAYEYIDGLLATSEIYQNADQRGARYRAWGNAVTEVKRA